MADFKLAIDKLLKTEGGYVNDPDDNGGETYKGIARKFWPSWLGWSIIDDYKQHDGFPTKPFTDHETEIDNQLQYEVKMFYYENFWVKVGADNTNNQVIAALIDDSAVNEGIIGAIKRAQEIVHLPVTGKLTAELTTKLNLL